MTHILPKHSLIFPSQLQNRACFRLCPSCLQTVTQSGAMEFPFGETGRTTHSTETMQHLTALRSATSCRGWHTGELKREQCNSVKVSALENCCTINLFRHHTGGDVVFSKLSGRESYQCAGCLRDQPPPSLTTKQTSHMHWQASYLGHQSSCPHTPCM